MTVPEWVYLAGVPPTDEEPFDLTEHATAATGSWLTALVIVAALFGAVLLAWRITRD